MKKIISNLIPTGNTIVTDGASFYNRLDNPRYGYEHSAHNLGHCDFGVGVDSISHIEQLWHNLKQQMILQSIILFHLKNLYYFYERLSFVEI